MYKRFTIECMIFAVIGIVLCLVLYAIYRVAITYAPSGLVGGLQEMVDTPRMRPLTCILTFTTKPSQYDHSREYDDCILMKHVCSEPTGATTLTKEAC